MSYMPSLTIRGAAFDVIREEVRAADDGLETGGILLGHQTAGQTSITVAGGPGPNARREPKRFLRDLEHARSLADRWWNCDRSQWVGEWHSHPTSEPVPSDVDLDSYSRHLGDPDLGFTEFVSLIVGLVDKQMTLAAWIITCDVAVLTPLTIEGTS